MVLLNLAVCPYLPSNGLAKCQLNSTTCVGYKREMNGMLGEVSVWCEYGRFEWFLNTH